MGAPLNRGQAARDLCAVAAYFASDHGFRVVEKLDAQDLMDLIEQRDSLLKSLQWAMTKLSLPAERSTESSGPYDYCDRYKAARDAISKATGAK